MMVRLELLQGCHLARITSSDGSINLTVPATAPILGRLNGRTHALFRAAYDDKTKSLELGDRVE